MKKETVCVNYFAKLLREKLHQSEYSEFPVHIKHELAFKT